MLGVVEEGGSEKGQSLAFVKLLLCAGLLFSVPFNAYLTPWANGHLVLPVRMELVNSREVSVDPGSPWSLD